MGAVKKPDLVYNIPEAHLAGCVDGNYISVYAASGGRSNSKTPGVVNHWLANNPLATGVKLGKHNPGGPLPIGSYFVVAHEKQKNWLRLIPFSNNIMYGRDGMAIHGRGPRGSDGCIVPTDFSIVLRLCELVKNRESIGGEKIVLQVVAVGDIDYWSNRV